MNRTIAKIDPQNTLHDDKRLIRFLVFVSTVGRDTEVIRDYIKRQEEEDKRLEQMNLGR